MHPACTNTPQKKHASVNKSAAPAVCLWGIPDLMALRQGAALQHAAGSMAGTLSALHHHMHIARARCWTYGAQSGRSSGFMGSCWNTSTPRTSDSGRASGHCDSSTL